MRPPRSKSGVPITDNLADQLAEEAERGYRSESLVPLETLLSDRVLDGMLGFLVVRSILPDGDTSTQNLDRGDLRAALVEVLSWEGYGCSDS